MVVSVFVTEAFSSLYWELTIVGSILKPSLAQIIAAVTKFVGFRLPFGLKALFIVFPSTF